MRRHIAFLFLLAAVVVAISLLRPRGRAVEGIAAAPPLLPTIEGPPPNEPEPIVAETFAPPAATPAKGATPPVRRLPAPYVVRPTIVHVVDAGSEPVTHAPVFLLAPDTKPQEVRTDEEGRVEFTRRGRSRFHVFSFKPGVGAGSVEATSSRDELTLKYEKHQSLQFRCLSNEVPLESADVILVTDVILGTRVDASGAVVPILVSLPPRKLVTDREGICTFGGVLPPRRGDFRSWKTVPGIRHKVQASWHMLRVEQTLDTGSDSTVDLFLR